MKSPLIKLNFNGGELSPFLDARIDFPKYASGAKEMTNFVPTTYGPMTKRPGTRFVEDLGGDAALFPFEFSESQAYIIAFKEDEISIYTGDGVLVDDMGEPITLPNPYTLEESKTLRFAQTGDLIYFTHPIKGMQKLSRISATEFLLEAFEPVNGPFQDENPDDSFTITISGATTLTIVANSSLFSDDDIGATLRAGYNPATEFNEWIASSGNYSSGDYIQYEERIYQVTGGSGTTGTRAPLHEKGSKSDGALTLAYVSDGFGYAKITGFTSDTEVTAELQKDFPPKIIGVATDEWSWGAFGGRFGWPNAVVFHQQRMLLGGSLEQPQTIWGSTIDDIEDFTQGTDDDDSYSFTIAANKKNPIAWLVSNISLNIGTLGGEFIASSSGASITPSDISIEQIGQYGSSQAVNPLIANGFTVFVQAGGRKLRELRFDEDSQRNFARDLNKIAEHIGDAGFSQIVYQAEPYQIVWCVIGDELYALTYETDENVYAWSRQDCGAVSSISVIPNGGTDRLWMVVKRSGGYYIEYLTKFYRRTDDLDSAVFVDSSLVYEGSEIQTLTGLDHLEGETVSVLNEGSVGQQQVVVDGAITLQYPTSTCVVGLPMHSAWQSLRLEGGSNDGLGQGKSKRISQVIFRLENTGTGLKYGKGTTDKEFSTFSSALVVRELNDYMDAPPSLLTGDTYRQPVEGGTDTQYMFRVEHDAPVPCTIVGIILSQDTNQ